MGALIGSPQTQPILTVCLCHCCKPDYYSENWIVYLDGFRQTYRNGFDKSFADFSTTTKTRGQLFFKNRQTNSSEVLFFGRQITGNTESSVS